MKRRRLIALVRRSKLNQACPLLSSTRTAHALPAGGNTQGDIWIVELLL